MTNVRLLKCAYLAAVAAADYFDYKGRGLCALLDLDPKFAESYVSWEYHRKTPVGARPRSRSYKSLWDRHDHVEVMKSIVVRIWYMRSRGVPFREGAFMEQLFFDARGKEPSAPTCDRQDAVLGSKRRLEFMAAELAAVHARPMQRLGVRRA